MLYGSLTEERAAIVAALAGVDGIQPYGTMPDTPSPGDAWPSWVQSTPQTQCGMATVWHVLIVVASADLKTMTEAMDRYMPGVYAALLAVGTPELAEPASLVTEQTSVTIPCIRVRVTT